MNPKKCMCCGLSEKDYPYLFEEDMEECPRCEANLDFMVEEEDGLGQKDNP